jgi:hypothetical protein
MLWTVLFHADFRPEFDKFGIKIQDEILALTELLSTVGPTLRRPHADTLKGSRHSNMKELCFKAEDGPWRVAFAFDPERRAIILVAGNKAGISQKRFYKALIEKADDRFTQHLANTNLRNN